MLTSVSRTVVNFLRWWGRELNGIFVAAAPVGSARFSRRTVLSVEKNGLRILHEHKGRCEELETFDGRDFGADAAITAFAKVARNRRRSAAGIRFSHTDCFQRVVKFPGAAEHDIAKALQLDLERTTPFRPSDVYTAHYICDDNEASDHQVAANQVIIKRHTVDPILDVASESGVALTFVDCWNPNQDAPLPIDFLTAQDGRPSSSARGTNLLKGLIAACVFLAMAATALMFMRQHDALEKLTAATTTARNQANLVRQAIDRSETAASQLAVISKLRNDRTSTARILESLTSLIPDTAWLTDLRIDGETIEITGYARSATSLIQLFDRSELFAGATLSAPVMFDQRQDKERFSMRVSIKSSDVLAGSNPNKNIR